MSRIVSAGYQGDWALGDTVHFDFNSIDVTGAGIVLTGSPVVSIYVDGSTTEITAGVTLTASLDSRVGLNHLAIAATGGNGYATGTSCTAVVTTGTVDSVSAVARIAGSFSIEKRSGLRPTTAGRTLDVSAGGEAGLDWANIGSPTTAQNLSATNIDVDQIVASVSGAVGSVTGAVGSVTGAVGSVTGNVGGNVVGTVASVVGNVAGNVVGSVGSVVGAVGSVTGAVGSVTGNVGGNVTGSVGSVAGNVGGNVVGSVASVTGNVGGNVAGSVASVTADVGITQTGADKVWATAARTLTSFAGLLSSVVEGTMTVVQSLRLANSANASKVSGAATTTVVVRDVNDTKDRITATVDADGNRTAVTLDVT